MRSHPSVCQGSCTFQKPWCCIQFGTVRFLPDAHWPQLAPKRCKARATAVVPPAEGKKPSLQLLSKYQTISDSVTSLKVWVTLDISSRSFPWPTCLNKTKPAKLSTMQEQNWPHFQDTSSNQNTFDAVLWQRHFGQITYGKSGHNL